jgi:quercetin dioxygenase-like cupin family protein
MSFRKRSLFFMSAATVVLAVLAARGGREASRTASAAAAPAAGPPAIRVQSLDKVAEEKSSWGSIRWVMNAKLDPQSNMTLGVVELYAGQSNPLHVHANCEEVIYVLSGACEHRVGNQTVILKAGDALHIPAGVPHRAKVLGKEPLRSVVAYNTGSRQFAAVKDKDAR